MTPEKKSARLRNHNGWAKHMRPDGKAQANRLCRRRARLAARTRCTD